MKNTHSTAVALFVLSSIAFAFSVVWTIVGDSDVKIIAITLTFMMFIMTGVNMEKSAIKHSGHGH